MALTNQRSAEAAWRALIPYQDGDLVLIHLNAWANNQNNQKNNIAATISAVVYGLVDLLDIPPSSIAVSDPSRRIKDPRPTARIIDGCRYKDEIAWDLYNNEYTVAVPFPSGQGPSAGDTLARVTAEADHIIMMPLLSWHSNFLTGAMKMMFGSLESQGGSMNHQATGSNSMYTSAAIADLCLSIKDRVRLLVGDGLFGNTISNSGLPHAFQTLGGQGGTKPSSTLYFTKDMVALDSVMYDDLLDETPKNGYHKGFLEYAADADHALGTYEMRDNTGASTYSLIDLVEINRNINKK
jgi:uncharacterized protein (DUF362 family)